MSPKDQVLEQDRALRMKSLEATEVQHEMRLAGSVHIHNVIGGSGPLIVLLHGFPQHSREWRFTMPALIDAGYSVIAPDLPGFGYSDKPLDGFDTGTIADILRTVVSQFNGGHRKLTVVGHDVGASVGYTWAAAHPEEIEQLVLIEGLPAGLEPPSAGMPMLRGKPLWHLAFGMTPDVPERLLADREQVFVEFLLRQGSYDPTTFSDEDIDAYTRTFASIGGVRGALSHIRSIPRSAALNKKLAERKLTMPVLAIGSELSYGEHMAEGARQLAEDVTGAVARQCGHWIPEERPAWLAQQLLSFFGAESKSGRAA